jgi:hypothetical protein
VKTPTLKGRDGAAVDKANIEAFKRDFRGQALLPGDAVTIQCAGPMWRPSERWRSRWDGEFESPLLQQAVCLSGERRDCTGKPRTLAAFCGWLGT